MSPAVLLVALPVASHSCTVVLEPAPDSCPVMKKVPNVQVCDATNASCVFNSRVQKKYVFDFAKAAVLNQ